MTVEELLKSLNNSPASLEFSEVMQVIDDNYSYTPVRFTCGDAVNNAGSNEGSCKILGFARLHNISAEQTPYLFGRYYRVDVLENRNGTDHANIRNFLQQGWTGVSFDSEPLA